jgi:hypothetical protein
MISFFNSSCTGNKSEVWDNGRFNSNYLLIYCNSMPSFVFQEIQRWIPGSENKWLSTHDDV